MGVYRGFYPSSFFGDDVYKIVNEYSLYQWLERVLDGHLVVRVIKVVLKRFFGIEGY